MSDTINYADFSKIDIRVGTIISAEDFPEARNPAYKIKIDFGNLGIFKSSAQITNLYSRKELIDRQVICVINFSPKQIANYISECLILGVMWEKGNVVLLSPDRFVRNGLRIG